MLRLKNLVFDDPVLPEEFIPILVPTLEVSAVYKPTPAFSPRILEVERQFSLGEIAEEFTVFKDFKLEFNDGDVIYITGESGGGKSTLLKAFKKLYEPQCIDLNEVKPSEDEVLANSIGDDLNEALYLLNNVGLGEAWLFIRRYGELSDGQKYRYRLAKAIYLAKRHRVKALICDEFCSTLDRITAKIVAYLTQKVCRRFGLTVIVATAHEDLLEDLNPNILIVKPFQKPPIVKRFQPKPQQCSIMEKIRIEEGTFKDYLQLEVYHYKGFRPAFPKKIFKAVYGDEVVGVIVYTMSFLNNRGRVVVFGSDLKDKAKRGEILRIARVVVAPRFRGIGLGSRLVSETLEKAGAEIVEALAAMAVYNPFFEKAGMKLGYVYTGDEKLLRKYVDLLEGYGFDPNRMHSYSHLKTVIMNMPDERLKSFQMELSKITLKRTVGGWLKLKNRLKTGDVQREKLATYLMQYATLQTKTYYYYWKK